MLDIIKNNIPNIFKFLQKKYKDFEFKTEEELGYIYDDYLDYSKKKYTYIKTMLYKTEPKPLYTFYENVDIYSPQDGLIIKTDDINNIIGKSNKIIITGTGGIGKSILMKHLFLNSIEKGVKIPIFIELRDLNDLKQINLLDYIYNSVKSLHLNIKKEYFEDTLKKGNYLILLDGFDEVKGNLVDILSKEIQLFTDLYNNNSFIISSRPSETYVGWNNFYEFSAMNLTKEQAISLVKKIGYDKEISKKFIEQLNKSLYKKYRSLAQIPLLLNIMLLTFENGLEIPDKVNDFYESAYNALFQKHDSLKGGFKRALLTNLNSAEFKQHLSYISFKSFFESKIDMNHGELVSYINLSSSKFIESHSFNPDHYIIDLTEAVCMLIRDGLKYKYSHRTFQEYFCAVYVAQLEDKIQSKFLVSWMEENPNARKFSNTFFECLMNNQKNRYLLNVAIPFVELYEEQFNNNSFESIVERMFISLRISSMPEDKEEPLTFTISDEFRNIFNIHFDIIKSIGMQLKDIDDPIDYTEIISEFKLNQKFKMNTSYTFEEYKEMGEYHNMMKLIKAWWYPRSKFILSWKNEFLESKNTKKRKFNSILSDL